MKRPEIEEIRNYCESRCNQVKPEAFFDYYESVGWMIGKKPMKNWQAAVRTWERKDKEAANAANRQGYRQSRGERNEQAYRQYLAGLQQEGANGGLLASVIEPQASK